MARGSHSHILVWVLVVATGCGGGDRRFTASGANTRATSSGAQVTADASAVSPPADLNAESQAAPGPTPGCPSDCYTSCSSGMNIGAFSGPNERATRCAGCRNVCMDTGRWPPGVNRQAVDRDLLGGAQHDERVPRPASRNAPARR